MFSLETITNKYRARFANVDAEIFKKILWGDYYFNNETKKFSKKPMLGTKKRTFV
jgi:hypothetical protein